MKLPAIRLVVLAFALAPWLAYSGGDEVVVVYNSRLPESKAVADHYAQARHVPKKQVFGFDLPKTEEISRSEFHDQLQEPLADKLERDNLWHLTTDIVTDSNGLMHVQARVATSRIRYAVLCYGVPFRIREDSGLHEPVENTMPQEFRRNEAAVDSELAWLPRFRMPYHLAGPMQNWVYGTTNTALLNPTNGILLVARLDGPTPEIASGLVDKALAAERDGWWGRAYVDTRGLTNGTYLLGDQWLLGAAEICRLSGLETIVDKNPNTFPADFPMSQIAVYAGWYVANADGPFALPKVEFMPGAFAYHLHSYSAYTLRSTNQYWCGPLLAKGATCTMGCVDEPYLIFTPNVAAFMARFFDGYTFGEAAWASQPALSWQITVIGDPLYCPCGRSPAEVHAELARTHSPLIEWSFLRLVNLDLVRGAPPEQMSAYLENIPATTNSAVLTEKLADLYEAQGKPSSAIDYYQLALTRGPSPEQRIRLRLTLADELLAAGRDQEAVEDYQHLLDESPDYPGQPGIQAKLTALKQKLALVADPNTGVSTNK